MHTLRPVVYEFDTLDGFRRQFMKRVRFLAWLSKIKSQGLTDQPFPKASEVEKCTIYRDLSGTMQKKRKTYSTCTEAIWANLGNNNK
jgi:hypothetical protein